MKRLLLRWLVIAYNVPLLAQGEVLSRELEMVTTQVALDSKSTCGTAVCVVSLNTNLSNLTNRAGENLQVEGNSIRVSFNTNLSNLTNRAG